MGHLQPEVLQEMSIVCRRDCLFFSKAKDGSAGCYLTYDTATPGVPCPVEDAREAELRAIEKEQAEKYRKYQERQRKLLDFLYE